MLRPVGRERRSSLLLTDFTFAKHETRRCGIAPGM